MIRITTFLGPKRLVDLKIKKVVEIKNLETIPKYVCFSYVWGNSSSKSLIKYNVDWNTTMNNINRLDDMCVIGLNYALYAWIDVLCIDQNNDEEKIIEIANMKFIYQQCILCIGFLSDLCDNIFIEINNNINNMINIGKECIKNNDPFYENNEKAVIMIKTGKILNNLVKSTWFTRVWTLQEWLLPNKMVLINNKKLNISISHDDIILSSGISKSLGLDAYCT